MQTLKDQALDMGPETIKETLHDYELALKTSSIAGNEDKNSLRTISDSQWLIGQFNKVFKGTYRVEVYVKKDTGDIVQRIVEEKTRKIEYVTGKLGEEYMAGFSQVLGSRADLEDVPSSYEVTTPPRTEDEPVPFTLPSTRPNIPLGIVHEPVPVRPGSILS